MALRDQPYLPLYVQDFLTDEKLMECSAQSTGVYIRLICLMHKSETYGQIKLKNNSGDLVKSFASQLAKHFPYDFHIVEKSLVELLNEKVLTMEGDFLIQKRMVKDNQISLLRANSGKIGGKKTQESNFAKANAKAKTEANHKANPEYEIEIESKEDLKIKNFKEEEKEKLKKEKDFNPLFGKMIEAWKLWLKYKPKKFKNENSEAIGRKKFFELCGGEDGNAFAIVENSIANGWAGLFPINQKQSNQIQQTSKIETMRSNVDEGMRNFLNKQNLSTNGKQVFELEAATVSEPTVE